MLARVDDLLAEVDAPTPIIELDLFEVSARGAVLEYLAANQSRPTALSCRAAFAASPQDAVSPRK